ncbi:MAG: formylglycine-generating enzyme family protein [Verrucomicrobiae bacterium]|nr:formylglycine-generating enzyme family protein [Verrucomicrobiae bacterium]
MKTFPALGRADLLRLRGKTGDFEAMARLLGYERLAEAGSHVGSGRKPDDGVEASGSQGGSLPVPPSIPAERGRLRFLVAVKAETTPSQKRARPRGNPISDAALEVNWAVPDPAIRPLNPWARLAPFLKRRLGAVTASTRIDLRRLTRHIGEGLPVTALPRRSRLAWAPQAAIWWDATSEMDPFRCDIEWAIQRLKRERGAGGLGVRVFRSVPAPAQVAGIPPGTPIVLLSALGQFIRSGETMAAWRALAGYLASRGHPIQVLTPCPRGRWKKEVARAWPGAVWDRRHRLPRHGGLRQPAAVSIEDDSSTADGLLDLLAPSSRIEAPLLRAARLRLGAGADAGTEWDAWHHADCWRGPDCFGLSPGESYDSRLQRRSTSGRKDPALFKDVGRLIREHHRSVSLAIAVEAELRACLSGSPDDTAMERAKGILRSVVDRLWLLATSTADRAPSEGAIPRWFIDMVGRLSPTMRGDPAARELVAQGLALAHAALKSVHVRVPEGVDEETFRQITDEAASRYPEPVEYRIELAGQARFASLRLIPAVSGSAGGQAVPLGGFRAASPRIHVGFPSPAGGHHSYRITEPGEVIELPKIERPTAMTLVSDIHRVRFEALERPPWAERMTYDRFGLAAEFEVGGVRFGLRWIPPGTFLMGSPEDEPGRADWEGPQHEVTLSRGFWLGETPVTQAQWRAVVEAAGREAGGVNPSPSYFQGPVDLPVEQVSHTDCEAFCRLLDGVLPMGPGFGLPTEAQWEYACRAGTTTALYTGGITIEGENNAPELDPIAWYGGNSGLDVEVRNPHDSRDWPNKRHPHEGAGTHRVRLKDPNPWGLYDMLGNVWEWCRDGWRDRYETESGVNPVLETKAGASRVVRGGSWGPHARVCRAAYRYRWDPGDRGNGRGFRLAAGQELGAAEPRGSGAPGSGAGEAEPGLRDEARRPRPPRSGGKIFEAT